MSRKSICIRDHKQNSVVSGLILVTSKIKTQFQTRYMLHFGALLVSAKGIIYSLCEMIYSHALKPMKVLLG